MVWAALSVGSARFEAGIRSVHRCRGAFSHPSMQPVTRAFSNLHAALYRLTGGAAQSRKYPTMLLTVTGRKSGQPRTDPLIYINDGNRFVITAASLVQFRVNPTWWLNFRDHPDAVVQVNNKTVPVRAKLAPADKRRDLWRRLVAILSILHRLPAADAPRDTRRDPDALRAPR